jgi:L-iditol 2-dehydrogenase
LMLAVVKQDAAAAVANVPEPTLASDAEVLLAIELAGICRTDLYAARGRIAVAAPVILGHEGVASVRATGRAVTGLRVGDRVAIDPWVACGHCAVCNAATPVRCPHAQLLGVDRNGVFAEYAVIAARQLHLVPTTLSSRRAAYVEPVAAALAVLDVGLGRAQRGLVLGRGRIAELVHRVLVASGYAELERAEVPTRDDYDFVVETSADAATLRTALLAVRPRGTVVLKSRPATPTPLDVGLAVRKDVTLRAASYGAFPAAIDLLASPRFAVDDLLGETFSLAQFELALSREEGSETQKTFLSPRSG